MKALVKRKKLLFAEAGLVAGSGFAITFTILVIGHYFTDNHMILASLITIANIVKNLAWRVIFHNLNRREK